MNHIDADNENQMFLLSLWVEIKEKIMADSNFIDYVKARPQARIDKY